MLLRSQDKCIYIISFHLYNYPVRGLESSATCQRSQWILSGEAGIWNYIVWLQIQSSYKRKYLCSVSLSFTPYICLHGICMVKIQWTTPSLPSTKAPSAKGNIIREPQGLKKFFFPREFEPLIPGFCIRDPYTRGISISLEPTRKAEYQAPLQTSCIRIRV